MNIEFTKFRNEKDEVMCRVVITENGEVKNDLLFYNDASDTKIQPKLKETIESLPYIFESIYNNGKSNIDIKFESKEINI